MQVDWLALLGLTGVNGAILLVLGFLARSLFRSWQDKDVERYKASLESARDLHLHQLERDLEDHKAELQSRAGRRERIREEILSWANPILDAVHKLGGRLHNVLDEEEQGWQALKSGYGSDRWSIDYDYFMSSTLYAFAVYFCWIERLRAAMSFELFETHVEKDRFFDAIDAVSRALGEYPPKGYECRGTDYQVFRYQQQAIGEAMTGPTSDGSPSDACIGYHDFLKVYEKEPVMTERLHPLRRLLDGVTPTDDCRWKRLGATSEALGRLDRLCRQLLQTSRAARA